MVVPVVVKVVQPFTGDVQEGGVPHTLGVPPPPQLVSGVVQLGHVTVPLQPFEIVPQLFVAHPVGVHPHVNATPPPPHVFGDVQSWLLQQFPLSQVLEQHFMPLTAHWESVVHGPQELPTHTLVPLQSVLLQQFPAKHAPPQHFSPLAPHCESRLHAVQVLLVQI